MMNTNSHTRASIGGGSHTSRLPGALGRLAISGCTPFGMWKSVGELTGTTRLGIEEDDVVLVQEYMMVAFQLEAPPLLGGAQPKTPALNCKHLRLTRPSAELRQWGRKKFLATVGPRQIGAQSQAVGGPPPPRHLRAHPAPGGMDPYNMMAAIKKMDQEIGRSMAPLALNQQRIEETMAYQKKKELGKKDLYDFDLAKLKGWTHKRNVRGLYVFWRDVVNSNG